MSPLSAIVLGLLLLPALASGQYNGRSLMQAGTDATGPAEQLDAASPAALPPSTSGRANRSPAAVRPPTLLGTAKPATSRPLVAAAAAANDNAACPPATEHLSAPGCLCTLGGFNQPRTQQQAARRAERQQARGRHKNKTHNVCPAGYRCSPSAAHVLVAAGWQQRQQSSNLTELFDWPQGGRLGPALATRGVCVPCQLGEYCKEGSDEETWLSLSTCQLQHMAEHPGQARVGMAAASSTENCRGFKACPAGSFCPDSSTAQSCPPGRWCPQGSITSETCNITGLLTWNPFRTVTTDPVSVIESLVNAAAPLDGITCPANATSPLNGCPEGFFCPTPSLVKQCPEGFYCPGHTSEPVPCPVLASCSGRGLKEPGWSWLGLLLLFLLLVLLLAVLEYVRVKGRTRLQSSTQEEELLQLVAAVGFKVGTQGNSVELQRVGRGRHLSSTQHPGQLELPAHGLLAAHGHKAVGRGWAVLKSLLPGKRRAGTFATTPSGTAAAAAPASHTALEMSNGQAHTKVVSDIESSTESHIEEEDEEEEEGPQEYTINPRLTLAFDEVWVADRPMSHGLQYKLKQHVKRLCCPGSTTDAAADLDLDDAGSASGQGPSQRSRRSSKASSMTSSVPDPLQSLAGELEAAACRGVKFIIPGVSGRFQHSQLHAIMGPSGCGKTSLCKALARRLPLNRFLGDVRVLVSSDSDGFTSESQLAVCSAEAGKRSKRGKHKSDLTLAARNIENMIGFVPQFDLLHESLTVMENLGVAAFLRLPLGSAGGMRGSIKGDDDGGSGCCARRERRKEQRLQMVHNTVAEVMALMALTKVAHQVVGSSSARMLSGGQRKRVAIGVELVAKPSLLFLDEPTSGLDAAVAYDVVGALKSSSERGMNVLAVLHQPRCAIFSMFDSCLLLSSCGHVNYLGPQRLALPYMNFLGFSIPAGENLADFLMDVIAGVVPRPGNPNFIPSQLATYWSKCGDIWIEEQLRYEQHGPSGDPQLDALHASSQAPASSAVVDWPWRPRDLEVLMSRFNLLVDAKRAAGRGRVGSSEEGRSGTGGSVLTYEGFLRFWDDSGLKELLGEELFAEFLGGLCEDFGMAPGRSITQAEFMVVLQTQLRAAATDTSAGPAAAGVPAQASTPRADVSAAGRAAIAPAGLQTLGEHPQQQQEVAAARGTEAPPSEFGHKSAFAAYSNSYELCQDDDQLIGLCSNGAAVADAACGPPCNDDVLACAVAAECAAAACDADPCGTAAEAAACAELAAACDALPECPELLAACPAAAAACRPGMLTCATERLRQHRMRRQRSRRSGPQPPPDPQTCQQLREEKMRQHVEVLQRLRQASNSGAATVGSASSVTGMQQLREARLLRAPSVVRLRSAAGLAPAGPPLNTNCTDLQTARSRCLDELGDFLLLRHLQAQQQQQGLCQGLPGSPPAAPLQSVLESEPAGKDVGSPAPAAAAIADPADRLQQLTSQRISTRMPNEAPSCHLAMAAVAAVVSRQLPRPVEQMRWIMARNARKWVSSRGALMTDLIMTAMLGLALGVAQGRNSNNPSSSVMWLLITLLAYGCTMLARSIHTYGSERHLYLQLESQAGVSVSGWVFGLQVFDLVALILHPALFFAWMYVLTLSPVPPWSFYLVLLVVGWYTSGIGYLVSLALPPRTALIAGLAAALLLGGVANGVAPRMWQVSNSHPILWLDQISYTRWGLQALYTSWLTPTTAAQAPATAAFLAGLGFCGLDGRLLTALYAQDDSQAAEADNNSTGVQLNGTAGGQAWWKLNSTQRADMLAAGAAAEVERSASSGRLPSADVAGAAAITQLWSYYNHPEALRAQCRRKQVQGYCVLLGLGLLCRLLVWLLVKFKVHKKAHE